MSIYELPKSLEILGESFKIRSDFRPALDTIIALGDPNLDNLAKTVILLCNLYTDAYDLLLESDYDISRCGHRLAEIFPDVVLARDKAIWFLSGGKNSKSGPRLMDWEQDFNLIISPINQIIGQEVRALPYLHWWTFLSAYLNIGESAFSSIVEIRRKLKKGKKLEKWERDFYNENRDVVTLRTRISEDDETEIAKIFGDEV